MQLDDTRKARITERLRRFYATEFDETLSAMRAERLLEFILEVTGPEVYNQGVHDAQAYMRTKLDDLDADVGMPESL